MRAINSVGDLEVYTLAFETAMNIFEISKTFPQEERYSLTDQIRRASRSVCANLETQTWLQFALQCKYIKKEIFEELNEKYEHIFAMLNNMEKKADSFCKS